LVRCGKAHYEFFGGTITKLENLKIRPTLHTKELTDELIKVAENAEDVIKEEAKAILLEISGDMDDVTRRNTLLNSAKDQEDMKKIQTELQLSSSSSTSDRNPTNTTSESPKQRTT